MNPYLSQLISLASVSKYTNWCRSIIERALNRSDLEERGERHHILPRSFSLGGERDSKNLVRLTIKEHFIVHHLLSKMFTGVFKKKMQYAFWAMCHLYTNDRRCPARFFESARKEFVRVHTGRKHSDESRAKMSTSRKGKQTGAENPMFGRCGKLHHGYGKPGPWVGRKHSPETLLKLKQIQNDPELRARIRDKNLGYKPTEATRAKLIEVQNRPEQKAHRARLFSGSGNPRACRWHIEELSSGVSFETDDLKNTCFERNWKYTPLMVAKKKGKPYKGFVFKKILRLRCA